MTKRKGTSKKDTQYNDQKKKDRQYNDQKKRYVEEGQTIQWPKEKAQNNDMSLDKKLNIYYQS